MKVFQGRTISGGNACGKALITTVPLNLMAAFSKPANLLPWWHSRINDRHHPLYKRSVGGRVLIYPATIGATWTGPALLELIFRGHAPAAIIVGRADTLMVSGAILAEVWFGRGIPIVEYTGQDIFALIREHDSVEVDGDAGTFSIL